MSERYVVRHAFLRPVRLPRSFGVDPDEVLPEDADDDGSREVLLAVYREVCATWRELVGVRFKLLGFVPTVSFLALGGILARQELRTALGVSIAVFGMLATIALMTYDQRNSQLHDELISRGRRIEFELGINVGLFRGRPGSRGLVKHDYAVLAIYLSSIAAWAFGTYFLLRPW